MASEIGRVVVDGTGLGGGRVQVVGFEVGHGGKRFRNL
jgi:hypothetical protein